MKKCTFLLTVLNIANKCVQQYHFRKKLRSTIPFSKNAISDNRYQVSLDRRGALWYRRGTLRYRRGTLWYHRGTLRYRRGTLRYYSQGATLVPFRSRDFWLPGWPPLLLTYIYCLIKDTCTDDRSHLEMGLSAYMWQSLKFWVRYNNHECNDNKLLSL